ncbi:MAG: molecular chaperone TorD family protein [Deltaproteobacteria bacterium]|nr:molecular chaperone TorD family protein [Deltaproteobacteria bacterium]
MGYENRQLDAGWERPRGQIYSFFAYVLLNRPDQQMLTGLLSEQVLAALQLIFPDHSATKRLARLVAEPLRIHHLREDFLLDYEALFRVPGDTYTHPYESAYLAAQDRNVGLDKLVLNPNRARLVVESYQELGLTPGGNFDEQPDHLGAQLDFAAHLCRLTAEELDKGESQNALRLKDHQESFLREHLLAWGGECLAKVERQASTELYQCLAGLGKAFLNSERQEILH